MKPIGVLVCFLIFLQSCAQQATNEPTKTGVGGPCEGCEAIHESPITFKELLHQDTLPDYNDAAMKLHLRGTVYRLDGRTPAAGVILYVYHTDGNGIYPKKGDETAWAKRHGYLRGWVKTNNRGEYAFYTTKPAAYPGRTEPAHIHITVKEPDKNEYYIDEYLFDDDPLLTSTHRQRLQQRGGDGIVKLMQQGMTLSAERNIILGKNIPGY